MPLKVSKKCKIAEVEKRIIGPDGKPLMPLAVAVQTMMLRGFRRGQIVHELCPIYEISSRTIDTAIEQTKAYIKQQAERTKEEVLADSQAKLAEVFQVAVALGQPAAANGAVLALHKIRGELNPEVVLGLTPGDAEALQAQADALKAKAAEAVARAKKA